VADIQLIKGRTLKLTGTPAWLAWMFVHIVMLLGNRNRLATLVNLATKYFAPSRRTNPIVGDVPVFEPQLRLDEQHRNVYEAAEKAQSDPHSVAR
jgi:NADH dehydrogenase